MRLPDLDLRGRPRAAWLAGLTLIALAVVAVAGAAIIRMSSAHHEHAPNHASAQHVPARAASDHPRGPAPHNAQPALADEANQLKEASHVQPAASTAYPRIHGPATHQPDLFARAFATRLLTQDYRTPRRQLLGWVQAESATTSEPTVIALVPRDQRDKWALYSLTTDQPTPIIPPKDVWRQLARHHGHTTVKIQEVSEPVAWSQAVLAGKVTDPGITAREIDAMVTLHTSVDGKPHSSVTSVALTINLEGPPSRGSYGFVTAVTYDVAPGAPR